MKNYLKILTLKTVLMMNKSQAKNKRKFVKTKNHHKMMFKKLKK